MQEYVVVSTCETRYSLVGSFSYIYPWAFAGGNLLTGIHFSKSLNLSDFDL